MDSYTFYLTFFMFLFTASSLFREWVRLHGALSTDYCLQCIKMGFIVENEFPCQRLCFPVALLTQA